MTASKIALKDSWPTGPYNLMKSVHACNNLTFAQTTRTISSPPKIGPDWGLDGGGEAVPVCTAEGDIC